MQMTLDEITTLLKAIEVAINRKCFSKEELDQFFDIWNTQVSEIEKFRRIEIKNQMYKEDKKVDEPKEIVM